MVKKQDLQIVERFCSEIGAVLFPLLFTFIVVEFISRKSELFRQGRAKAALYFGFLLMAGYGATHLHPTFTKDYFLHQILKIYTMIQSESAGKNTITFPDLQPTFESLAHYAPEALFSAIYRPFIWEQNSKFLYAVSLENLFLVFLTLVFFYSLIKNGLSKFNLFYLSLFFYIPIIPMLDKIRKNSVVKRPVITRRQQRKTSCCRRSRSKNVFAAAGFMS